MNKNDVKLIIILLFVSIFCILILNLIKKDSSVALVYYNNEIVKEIDLNVDDKYEIKGYNGKVILEVKNNKIRVVEETSDYHLCSNQGFISKSYETIVCLPNKVVITIKSNDDYDTIVR